ncbi:putative MFS monocarboxylate transporter [Aspergillus affinis]|uniref:putative MFS monocarboxylate transporter n=1 Tax=Aspergillus affinis TaxID=1070780 RepID=UPI0022FDCFC0|nr:putative MFS monocarboxylate transporter [Aspergillus affinis]KAI9034902.1 putative MFS monocarboxylate transporter [Aspergillus affinis]
MGVSRWFLIMCLALAMSSFSTTTTHLMLSQGILYGVGSSIAYTPLVIFMNEWFERKRGLAFGIIHRPRPLNCSFLKERSFDIYQLGNTLESFGFFLPTIYLPSYARTLGASNRNASITAILFNIGTIIGSTIMGTFVDRYHATTCIMTSTIGGTIAVFVLWGVSMSLAPVNPYADDGMVFAFLCVDRGIGNVISRPWSDALMKTDWRGVGDAYAGS